VLASWASALNDAGHFAYLFDASWRFVFVTDELRLGWGEWGETDTMTVVPMGSHFLSAKAFRFRAELGGQFADREGRRAWFSRVGPFVLATTPGGRDALRPLVNPEVADLVDELEPEEVPAAVTYRSSFTTAGADAASGTQCFALTVPTDDSPVRACCRNPRQECRGSRRRPGSQTCRTSNGCASSSLLIGAPRRF
jgi:hypothetical protein